MQLAYIIVTAVFLVAGAVAIVALVRRQMDRMVQEVERLQAELDHYRTEVETTSQAEQALRAETAKLRRRIEAMGGPF